jgi:phenylpyruvate tautomerase PptA (4-oxalocrotonate tautomerase family)
VKRGLARRLGEKYARIMQTTPDMVTVAFRELGEGGVWRCNAGEPEPAAVLSCDIRRGRLPEQRAELAEALIDACVETLGLRSDRLVVEFTQHTRDEMYRAGRGGLPYGHRPRRQTHANSPKIAMATNMLIATAAGAKVHRSAAEAHGETHDVKIHR